MDIESLILKGALEPAGVDSETGEILYSFTDKLKDINPVLHREVNNMFNSHIMKMWELGMLDMDITANNPIVRLTDRAFDESLINSLNDEEAYTLKEIKRKLIRE